MTPPPGSPGTLVPQPSAQIVSHTSVKSPAPPTQHHEASCSCCPRIRAPPSPPYYIPAPPPPTLEEDERISGEGPGPGQEGRVPVGRPPVCPRLILAAFSLAWRSGPVAPAVILRFLGHCHAGSAAKWGAGGVGAASRAKGREGDACGRVAGTGVCAKAAGALGGVSSLLPACLGQCGAADLDRWSPEGLGFLV